MIALINKDSLYNIFGIKAFQSLEGAVDSMAPSLVEYHLSNLVNYADDTYLNKRDVEEKISVGDYNLYIDYSENIYLELPESDMDEMTQTLW